MKISFEGDLSSITKQLVNFLTDISKPNTVDPVPVAKAQGPGPDPFNGAGHVDKPVEKPADKPVEKPERTAKQQANDERLRILALQKVAAKKAAKEAAKEAKATAPAPEPVPPPKSAEGMDPAEVVKVRQKTIEDLQSAYANGFQKQVFELLSKFGNGAKSFRELPPESFVPIREAIDNGALT